MNKATKAEREAAIICARVKYAAPSDNDLEIDDAPATSEGEDGMWVAAWVFVPKYEYKVQS